MMSKSSHGHFALTIPLWISYEETIRFLKWFSNQFDEHETGNEKKNPDKKCRALHLFADREIDILGISFVAADGTKRTNHPYQKRIK